MYNNVKGGLGNNVTLENQYQLEQEMVDGGIDRFKNETAKALTAKKESRTLHGRTIITNAIEAVAKGVDEIKAGKSNRDIAKKKLADIPSDVVAYLAVSTLVDGLSASTVLLGTAIKLGTTIEIQDRLHKWVQAEGSTALNVIKLANEKGESARAVGLIHKMNKDGYSELAWRKEEKMHVGLRLIDAIIINTGLVKIETIMMARDKKASYVKPTEKTQEWIKAFNDTYESWKPRFAPCIIEPKDWTDITGGGYHSPMIEPQSIVRGWISNDD